MSQLLFDWLNEDVGLSRKVLTFGDDFKDGYMFGELLSKFNQQLDFHKFSSKGTPAARLNNFCLLEPSMRKIGVHFNSRIVTGIMAGKETIVKNLLYEMKTALEGIYRINKQNNNQMLHGTASDKALHVIKPARPLYEKTISATYASAIHRTVENTNEVLMQEVMRPHASKEIEYLQTMSSADGDAYNAFMDTRLREKEINRNKKVKADEFAKSWEAQHVAQWKVNQKIAHDRRILKAKVEEDVHVRKQGLRTRLLEATRTDTLVGMESFNDRLDKSLLVAGADLKGDVDSLIKTTSVPGDKNLTLMYVDREVQRRGFEATQKKMKEHHEDIAVRALEHDQRRRKFLREYDTMQMKMSQNIFNTEVIAQMLNFAESEKVEQAAMEKVINYKKIIPDNRRNRQELMDKMSEEDKRRGTEWDAVEAQREVHWNIGGARDSHGARSEALKTAAASADRHISTTIALESIDKLLDVVDWVVSCRQIGVFYYDINDDPAVLTAALPEAAPTGGKKGKEKEKEKVSAAPASDEAGASAPKPRSCKEGDVVPADVWADAAKMFMAVDPVSAALHIPAPLQVTDALWPFSISERPACAEMDWLFAQPFHDDEVLQRPILPATELLSNEVAMASAAVTCADGQATATATSGGDSAGAAPDSRVDAAPQEESAKVSEQAPDDPPMKLALCVSKADVVDFIETLNTAEIPVGLGTEGKELTLEPEPTEESTLYTPTWLTNVQPRHFLGETLIAVRRAVDPIPDQPEAVIDTSHIPLRAALCGVSELARQNLVEALVKQIPGLTVIVVQDLVTRAFEFHQNVLNAPKQNVAEVVEEKEEEVAEEGDVGAVDGEGAFPVSSVVDELQQEQQQEKNEPVQETVPDTTLNEMVAPDYNDQESIVDPAVGGDQAMDGGAEDSSPTTLPEQNEASAVSVPVSEPESEPTPDPFPELAQSVYDCLIAGSTVPDDMYVSLVVYAIKQIHVRNTGYVIQDFPSTKRQAVLLMEAFSGINYDSRRPQPTDKVSPYAPPSPAETWTYDISKCGLDMIVHVDNGEGILTSFDQRARVRKVTESGEIVYISDDQATIKGLELIDVPSRPFLATGVDLEMSDKCNLDLIAFCAKIRLLDHFVLSDYPSVEEAVAVKAKGLCERFIPGDYFLPGYLPGTELPEPEPEPEPELPEVPVEEEPEPEPVEEPVQELESDVEKTPLEGEECQPVEGEAPVSAADTATSAPVAASASEGSAPIDGVDPEAVVEPEPEPEPVKEKYIYQQPPAIFQPNAIPVALAEALLNMWNASEEQSGRKAQTYFSLMRNVRYQMMQRRRAAFDSVSTLLVKLDNRQEIFDQFRIKFNEVTSDMRFDPECVAELHLQTLELCDSLIKLSEERKIVAEAYTKKVGADAVVTVLQHRCRCESVAMAQSELQRFFVVLHLLFDYAKSVRGYEMRGKILNELEVALPVTLPAESDGGKKDKGKDAKKGKEVPGALVPFREPIAAVLVSRAGLDAVPDVNCGDEAIDAKAKKPPAKDKKGTGDSADPFADIEAKILEEAERWKKGTFTVTRDVYEKDEALSAAVEQAIWYEAEKLILGIRNIRSNLESNVAWLDAADQEMNVIMQDMVSKRYVRELTAVNQLVERIEQSIADAQPVPNFWLVSPDASAVDPELVWDQYMGFLPPEFLPELPPITPPPEPAEPQEEEEGRAGSSLQKFKPHVSPANSHKLGKTKKGGVRDGKYVPEHSAHETDLSTKQKSQQAKKMRMKRQSTASKMTHLRGARSGSSKNVPTDVSSQDEKFRREMAVYEAKRLTFEDKLLKRRAQREREFRTMGMSAVTAKLAAYNDLLLDEEQDMLDFDARHKPKRRPKSHVANSKAGSKRPASANVSRPNSACASVH